MSTSAPAEALLALQRFGMGPRPGSIGAIASDPRGALLAELDNPPPFSEAAAALPSSAKAVRAVADADARRQAKAIVATREEAKQPAADASMMAEDAAPKTSEMGQKMAAEAIPDPRRTIYLAEAKLRTEAALQATIGFTERLVWFWSNHFCVSAFKVRSMSGAYEREAIRPHMLGSFSDLLLAAENHPAMLFYLDNLGSMGASSVAGINRNKGPNENQSREALELHTLGVRAGYTQDDVISFANALTGWTWVPPYSSPDHGGEFAFNARMHQPGGQTVLGKRYEQEDIEQGRAVLRDLAVHPATATHIATKLARHFIADAPPPALVESIARAFRDSGGDLKETAKAMIAAPESWTLPPTKLKRPGEWVVAMVRSTGITTVDPERYTGGVALLGEPLWSPSSPKGFPDDEASWIDGIGRRLDISNAFAEREAEKVDPNEIIDNVLASQVSGEVKQAVGQAETRQQALSLLFMSTEFLRR
ncbi:DUF1800 family protein [Bradyrhizobium sp.]|uniref:DUF1800 domain-containing protein n=1 Tax=Bradyrhizobium sp. TaxID=376 RepID=UPI001ED2479A|nr:DUF1800 family protein [Bradyrhizobium sp.]MBV9979329.1 DUF1800 family protein [Bradyrhizobium sp.]